MPRQPDSEFHKNGFAILDTDKRGAILELRRQFLRAFSTIAQLNGLPPVETDEQVMEFYRTRKDLWVLAYDQVRQLPGIYTQVDDDLLERIKKVSGIEFPALTSKIATRIDMPYGEGSAPTISHQDYPTHQGSFNSVTVWYPLQDTGFEEGTVQVIPGSHLQGLYNFDSKLNDFVEPGKLRRVKDPTSYLTEDPLNEKFVPVEVKAGQFLVFSTLLIHRSGLNKSKNIRFCVNLRYNDLTCPEYASRKWFLNEQTALKNREVPFAPRYPELSS